MRDSPVPMPANLKYSDMLGLPHDLVKALRADGWYWRDEIIWAKPNAMCESGLTRTTRNHAPTNLPEYR